MDVKKYIALGVSAVLVLTGGLLSIKGGGTDVKAGAGSKESKEIETMKDLRKLYKSSKGIESSTLLITSKYSETSGSSMSYEDYSVSHSETLTVENSVDIYDTEDERYTVVDGVMNYQIYSEAKGEEDSILNISLTVEIKCAIYDDGDEEVICINKYKTGLEYEYEIDGDEEENEELEEAKETLNESVDLIGEYLGEWLDIECLDQEDVFEEFLDIVAYDGDGYFEIAGEESDDDAFKKESDKLYKMKASAFEDEFEGIGSLKLDFSIKDSPIASYMCISGSEFSDDDDEGDYDDYEDMFDGMSFNSECVMRECVMTNINNTEIKAPKKMDIIERL